MSKAKSGFKKGQVVYLMDLSKWEILEIYGEEKNFLIIKLLDGDPEECIDSVDILNEEVFPNTLENREIVEKLLEAKFYYEKMKEENIEILIDSWLEYTNRE